MSKKLGNNFLTGLRDIKDEHAVIRPNAPDRAVVKPPHRAAPSQPGREGKVSITQWVDPLVRKQVAQIALDEDKNQQDLINEALNLLFEKYGRSPIA